MNIWCPEKNGSCSSLTCIYRCKLATKCTEYYKKYEAILVEPIEQKYFDKYGTPSFPIPDAIKKKEKALEKKAKDDAKKAKEAEKLAKVKAKEKAIKAKAKAKRDKIKAKEEKERLKEERKLKRKPRAKKVVVEAEAVPYVRKSLANRFQMFDDEPEVFVPQPV